MGVQKGKLDTDTQKKCHVVTEAETGAQADEGCQPPQKLGEARSLLQSLRGTARCHLHLELLALGSATGWASAACSLQFTELILPAVGG